MLYWAVNWSIRFRRIVVAVVVGLLVFGGLQFGNMKQDTLPEFSPTTVEVQTEALGLSAAEVERLVTTPLEQDLLNGVAFLDHIESVSLPGLSSVVMTFEPGTDVLDARQVVAERLTQAAGLPQVAAPPRMIQPLSSTSRVAMVSLDSDELTTIEISVLARWVMVPRLLGVEGVANVSIWGFRDRQLQVLVDPANLADQDVTLGQVIRTTGNALEVSPLSFLEASSPGTGGFIDTVNQRLHIFHEQAISTPAELEQVTLEGPDGGAVFVDGQPVALGEVAQIVEGHQPLIGNALCGDGPCVLLVVEKFPGANTPAVAEGVEDALEALSLGLEGMDIDTSVYQPAAYIESSVENLLGALLVGAIVLLALLRFFYRSWRIALVSVASIVAALAATGVVLFVADVTVNAMVWAGLVMALVVTLDDSLVTAWGIEESAAGEGVEQSHVVAAIVGASMRLRTVAFYSALIVGAVLLVVVAGEGETAAFLQPIMLTYFVAIAVALVVGLTVAPALSVFLLGGARTRWREPVLAVRLREGYRRFASSSVPKHGRALAVLGVLLLAGLVAVPFLSSSLRPDFKERDLTVQLEAEAGTSLPAMDEMVTRLATDLRNVPGVGNAGVHIGRAILSDQIVNVNSGEIWLTVDEEADYGETINAIDAVVDDYGELRGQVGTYSGQRVNAVLGRPSDELVVRVYGEDPVEREMLANQIQGVVDSVDGVVGSRIDSAVEESTVEVEVDLARAREFGLKPGDVRRQAAVLVSGIVVGNLFEDQRVFDVVVWGVPALRENLGDLHGLLIETPTGDPVPLDDVADVRVVSNPSVIRHESVASYVDVIAAVEGSRLSETAAEVDQRVSALAFPLEHHAEVLGGFATERAAQSRVLATVVAAVVLTFLLLQAAFTSWRLATLAFVALPAAVSGSLVVIALTGGEVTLGSVGGIVVAVGLASRGVILMIRAFQRRESLGEAFGEDLILNETTRLVAPTAISAFAVIAVSVPLLVIGSRAGLELAGPMAAAVLGGLVTTTVLTLGVLPPLYLRWGFIEEPDKSAQDLFAPEAPQAEIGTV